MSEFQLKAPSLGHAPAAPGHLLDEHLRRPAPYPPSALSGKPITPATAHSVFEHMTDGAFRPDHPLVPKLSPMPSPAEMLDGRRRGKQPPLNPTPPAPNANVEDHRAPAGDVKGPYSTPPLPLPDAQVHSQSKPWLDSLRGLLGIPTQK